MYRLAVAVVYSIVYRTLFEDCTRNTVSRVVRMVRFQVEPWPRQLDRKARGEAAPGRPAARSPGPRPRPAAPPGRGRSKGTFETTRVETTLVLLKILARNLGT